MKGLIWRWMTPRLMVNHLYLWWANVAGNIVMRYLAEKTKDMPQDPQSYLKREKFQREVTRIQVAMMILWKLGFLHPFDTRQFKPDMKGLLDYVKRLDVRNMIAYG